MKDYSGYKWIKVKRFKFDPEKSWEENYKALDQHHIEETSFLIDEVRKLADILTPRFLPPLDLLSPARSCCTGSGIPGEEELFGQWLCPSCKKKVDEWGKSNEN